MTLKKFVAGAAMTGGLAFGAFGLGAGIAQADPHGPNCNNGPGVNCNQPGSPLPPGQNGFPPPGHYNDPISYGLPATWIAPNTNVELPVVFNPDVGAWGVFTANGFVSLNT